MSEPFEDAELSAGQTAYRKRIADRKAKREAGFLKERMTAPAEHKDGSDEELIKSEVIQSPCLCSSLLRYGPCATR